MTEFNPSSSQREKCPLTTLLESDLKGAGDDCENNATVPKSRARLEDTPRMLWDEAPSSVWGLWVSGPVLGDYLAMVWVPFAERFQRPAGVFLVQLAGPFGLMSCTWSAHVTEVAETMSESDDPRLPPGGSRRTFSPARHGFHPRVEWPTVNVRMGPILVQATLGSEPSSHSEKLSILAPIFKPFFSFFSFFGRPKPNLFFFCGAGTRSGPRSKKVVFFRRGLKTSGP